MGVGIAFILEDSRVMDGETQMTIGPWCLLRSQVNNESYDHFHLPTWSELMIERRMSDDKKKTQFFSSSSRKRKESQKGEKKTPRSMFSGMFSSLSTFWNGGWLAMEDRMGGCMGYFYNYLGWGWSSYLFRLLVKMVDEWSESTELRSCVHPECYYGHSVRRILRWWEEYEKDFW